MSRETQQVMLAQLKNPFDPKFIKWRVGATNADKTKGIALAYLDSREVSKRLDEVMGLGQWQDRYIPVDGGFICELDLFIDDQWVTKSNTAGNTKVEPIKGGGSDAFKRAASKWGIGRYLYYLPNIWVPIKLQGKSYVLAETPELPDWATPNAVENWEDVAELETDTIGADPTEIAEIVIGNLDSIRSIKTTVDLESLIKTLSLEEQTILANEINIKRRELLHESEISTDNS